MKTAPSPNGTHEGYMTGFGNHFETEALAGTLPLGMNSPQRCARGLYNEQLSGTAFTMPGQRNRRTWCYRIRPSVRHGGDWQAVDLPYWRTAPDRRGRAPGPLRWGPLEAGPDRVDWLTGMRTMTTAGDADLQTGMACHVYLANVSMEHDYFACADAELLVVPQQGRLRILTELGVLDPGPGEIAVIPRGLVHRVEVPDAPARGFVCENYGSLFELPARGPVGANGLANQRDFLVPVAAFEDVEAPSTVTVKWGGRFHRTAIAHSPLDVVAWHGNLVPVKYDLARFCPFGALLFDHPDPSINTVLTAPSLIEGVADIDFVIFRDRWMVAEGTFRPPWFHRNVMSEFMGNIRGAYDARRSGFPPGAMALHTMLTPHGPDAQTFEHASNSDAGPEKLDDTLSFMFETRLAQHPTGFAMDEAPLRRDAGAIWSGLVRRF